MSRDRNYSSGADFIVALFSGLNATLMIARRRN